MRENVKSPQDDKINWTAAASAFDKIPQFTERPSCYSAPEIIQLHTLHYFYPKKQESIMQADIHYTFKQTVRACCRTQDVTLNEVLQAHKGQQEPN